MNFFLLSSSSAPTAEIEKPIGASADTDAYASATITNIIVSTFYFIE
jgi:hypothetical protein